MLREATQNVIAYFGIEILDESKAYLSAILDLLEMNAAESGVLIHHCNAEFLMYYSQTAKNCNLHTLNDAYEMGVCYLEEACLVREDVARSISLGIVQGIADACGCAAFEPNEFTQYGIVKYEAELDSTSDDENDEALPPLASPPKGTSHSHSMGLPVISGTANEATTQFSDCSSIDVPADNYQAYSADPGSASAASCRSANVSDNRSPIPKEMEDGRKEYQKACDLMRNHRGSPNYKKITYYLRLSRDKGYAKSYTALGNLYYSGIYFGVNYRKAHKYYMHAATNGCDQEAMYCLGLYYAEGIAVPKDYSEAKRWFERADGEKNNSSGHIQARFQLGKILFEGGHGIDKCMTDAISLLKSAKEAGCKDAKDFIEAYKI